MSKRESWARAQQRWYRQTGGLLLAILAFAIVSSPDRASAGSYKTPGELDLNRVASRLNAADRESLFGAHTGFRWNDGDNATLKWRPQGIAGYTEGSRKFLIVSWAGQPNDDYDGDDYAKTRGARISIVDVTSMSNVRYRHVLLVDSDGSVFPGLHAGGIVYRNGILHVADSRKGMNQILTFDIFEIEEKSKLGYRYVLRSQGAYPSPVKPSFLSYDWNRHEFLVGRFAKKAAHDCEDEPRYANSQLAWYADPMDAAAAVKYDDLFGQMQGAASSGDVLWTTHSYGRSNSSHLHVSCYRPGESLGISRSWAYPPGLEDMSLSLSSDNLWMLTEFGSKEGKGNNRVVFATHRSLLMPERGCP